MRALVLAACAALALAVAPTSAVADGTVDIFAPGAHTLAGELDDAERHFVPLELPAGTLLTLTFNADKRRNKGNELVPRAQLFGPDGELIEIPEAQIKTRRGFLAKNIVIPTTGAYVVSLFGDQDTGGKYTLRARARLPRPLKADMDFGSGPYEIPFSATTGAKVTFSINGRRNEALPDLPKVRRPEGGEFGPPKLRTTKLGVSVRNFEQTGEFGVYTLSFALRPGTEQGSRQFKYKIAVRFPRVRRAKLTYDDLIVAPTLFAVTPDEVATVADVTDFTISGRFFQEGSSVSIQLGEDLVPLEGVRLVEGGIQASRNTFNLKPGLWNVIVTSPSGGRAVLENALTILPNNPTLTNVNPAEGPDDLFDQLVTLTGSRLSEATEVTFRRQLPGGGESVFTPLSVTQSTASTINVVVNIARRPLGAYNVEAKNRGPSPIFDSETVVLANAFSIVNAPPRIDTASPGCITAGDPLTLTLRGREIEPGVRAFLRLDDNDVEGTGLTFNEPAQTVTASFDLSGLPGGSWTAALLNADGREGSLADAVQVVSGPVIDLIDNAIGQPDLAMADGEERILAVWVESDEDGKLSGNQWHIRAQVFDTSDDTTVGNVLTLSNPLQLDAGKRFVSTVYNPDSDEWLVVWTEKTDVPFVLEKAIQQGVGFSQDPRPSVPGTEFQVYARRVGIDGQTAGGIIDLIQHDETPVSSPPSSSQYYDEFPYENPQVVYAPWNGDYYLCMTQRWDHLSGSEDYDAYVWRLDKDDPDFDSNEHVALHTTQNHEGDVLLAVDVQRQLFLAVGACDSRQQAGAGTREIEAKIVLSNLTLQPGSGGSNVGEVYPITTRVSGESADFLNPRTAYEAGNGQYFVVYERKNESGSNNVEIRGQLFDASLRVNVGAEIIIAADDTYDLRRPRVIFNGQSGEYLVTWTVDDSTGSESFARGRRVNPEDGTFPGTAFDLACDGSGYPVAQVDGATGEYLVLMFLDYEKLEGIRGSGRLLLRRVK